MSKKIIFLLVGVVVLVSLTGCASIFKKKSIDVVINSEPSGADVFIKNDRVGRTPLTINLLHRRAAVISLKKSGYEDVTRTINNRIVPGWIIVDLVLAGPFTLVDLVTKNACSLSENEISVNLDAKQGELNNNQSE